MQTAKELKAQKLEEIKTLGLELKDEGLPAREIYAKVKENGYKISDKTLFNLLKDENGK